MKIYDSLTRKKKTFAPLAPGEVRMYVCGPTPYDVAHVGHARSAVSFDIIRRYFLYKGLTVVFVSNLTDVDDKIIARAAKEGLTERELTARIIPEYEKDYAGLSVMAPTQQPRATEWISKMVELVELLLQKKIAYETEDGIYFEVGKFPEYGKLSHQKLEELRAGARIAVDEKKKNPEDFALWKRQKAGEETVSWSGPAGMRGRPGWHIECSAMARGLLGETFDIHGGGIDLIFPHHECEVAQSEAASGKAFARFWLHNGHVKVNKEKMSKSIGNFFTIKEVLAKFHPSVVRYFLLSTHYRLPIDFSDEVLQQARSSVERLQDFMRRLNAYVAVKNETALPVKSALAAAKKSFESAMDDDFEIVKALTAIFDLVRDLNRAMDEHTVSAEDRIAAITLMQKFDGVLACLEAHNEAGDTEIEAMLAERTRARAARNFEKADEIRKTLEARGIILEDNPAGTTWKKAL